MLSSSSYRGRAAPGRTALRIARDDLRLLKAVPADAAALTRGCDRHAREIKRPRDRRAIERIECPGLLGTEPQRPNDFPAIACHEHMRMTQIGEDAFVGALAGPPTAAVLPAGPPPMMATS